MKKIIILFLMALVGFLYASSSYAASRKAAVYVDGNINEDNTYIVSSAIVARMAACNDYTPFERNEIFVRALNKELDFQLSGEVPEKEIRKVGERLGVDYAVVVYVTIGSDSQCYFTARIINIESGEILRTVNQRREYKDSQTLYSMANNVAYRLFNKKSK